MSEVHSARDLTNAVVALLTNAGYVVGDGQKAAAGGWAGAPGQSAFAPYVDVHPLQGGFVDGTIDSPDADVFPDYQMMSVGATREQAELLSDKVRTTLASAVFALTGRSVVRVRFDFPGGAVRDDDAQPPLFYTPDRFRFFTVPA